MSLYTKYVNFDNLLMNKSTYFMKIYFIREFYEPI